MLSTRLPHILLMTLSLGFLLNACARESNSGTPDAGTGKTASQAMSDPNVQLDSIILGMGCFWGAEKRMSEVPGVVDVESGYANGDIAGSYDAVLKHERALRLGRTGKRNHAEVVKVIYDPARTTLETVLARCQSAHPGLDPQGAADFDKTHSAGNHAAGLCHQLRRGRGAGRGARTSG